MPRNTLLLLTLPAVLAAAGAAPRPGVLPAPSAEAIPIEIRVPLRNGPFVPVKRRFVEVPQGQVLRASLTDSGGVVMEIPDGTVFTKDFYFETSRGAFLIERRTARKERGAFVFLAAHAQVPFDEDGDFSAPLNRLTLRRLAFRPQDALPVSRLTGPAGLELTDGNDAFSYLFPGQVLCTSCHGGAGGFFADAPGTTVFAPHPDSLTEAAWNRLVSRGALVEADPAAFTARRERLARSLSAAPDTLEARTAALLSALRHNCLSCHNPSAQAAARHTSFTLDPAKAYTPAELAEALSKTARFGRATGPIVVPGDPAASEIVRRLAGDRRRRMPPREGGVPEPDEALRAQVSAWIRSLGGATTNRIGESSSMP